MTDALFSYNLLTTRKTKALKTFHKANYLAKDLETTLVKRLPKSSKDLKKILVIGCPGNLIKKHFPEGTYDTFNPFLFPDFSDKNLPFEDKNYDLIVESFIFHWLNDPLDYLAEIHRLLRPGGLYLSGFLGGTTLTELRQAFLKTDIQFYEGAFARISPMIKPEAATRLLQTAGFKDPIVDHEETNVTYPTLKTLIQDLRFMGESNALKDQEAFKTSKNYRESATENYQKLFPQKNDNIIATFDFVFMTGWRSL